ncbi:MAG: SDR family oxidoreductase [Acidobacteria bacterium]|jgi:short-subunit dehydrogenase|nr:SDR family oxidoreductase [Acidobacteriota bacterium]
MTPLRALVTGASSGIGAAYARALRARGERLILVARRAARLAQLAEELGGDQWAVAFPVDLRDPGAVLELRERVAGRGFAVDLLVNNAGLGHTGPFEEQPAEIVRAMVDVNVRAVVELTHVFLPAMKERGQGRIVNVASNAAFQPVPFLAVYAATKAFVLSFTEGLAEELRGSGIQIQALCPGLTRTEFLEVAGTHEGLRVTRTPMLTAEEVVAASLRGLDRGRLRVVPGWTNRLAAIGQRFLPASVPRRLAAELHRPPPGGARSR